MTNRPIFGLVLAVAAAGCPYPDGALCRGPLAAGGPYKTNLFIPVFSLQVREGWDNTVDNPNEYQIMRSGPNGQPSQTGIYIFRDVAIQAVTCEDKPEPGIGRLPADMAAYLSNHPGLITTEPEAVNIGGLDGVMIEVSMDPTWTTPCFYSEGEPNVPLFWGADADSGLEWGTGPGVEDRFYILDMPGGGNVLIAVEAFGEGGLRVAPRGGNPARGEHDLRPELLLRPDRSRQVPPRANAGTISLPYAAS
jgi:hypothetical protein